MSIRWWLPAALALLLSACATPQSLKPGTSLEEARSLFWRPTAEIRLPDGGVRLQYSAQPNGQFVWNADFDANGRLRGVRQMMTDEAFLQVNAGKDTQADILRDFGPPADIYNFRLKNEIAFMYRYYTYGGFKAAMFVYFDPAGVVIRTETGMDPWSIQDSDRN